MSSAGSNLPPIPPRPGPGGTTPAPGARRASVTLRAQADGPDSSGLMDPANQSLADALRITYRVVQVLMIALAGLYLLSGFQMVKENELGIRVLFGVKQDEGLEPGFRFSWPAPLGELVKIDVTGNVTLDLYEDFWFNVPADKKGAPLSELNATPSLSPERDGSILTADNNIAHAKFQVVYRHDPAQIGRYAQNVLPDAERDIVRGAVKRAAVQTVGVTTIEDLLRDASGEAASIAARTKERAQAILDQSGAGIRIDQLKLEEKIPPLSLRERFAKVQTEAAAAASKKDTARQERDATLNAVAGAAAQPLIRMVERYEVALAKKDDAACVAIMKSIDDVLNGRATEFEGVSIPANLVSGEVTKILAEARQYSTETVNLRRSEAMMFKAKLEQFRLSPLVMVQREWADSMTAFMDHPSVQILSAPLGLGTLQLNINADPLLGKRAEMERRRAENDAEKEKRAQQQRDAEFKLNTGLKARGD